MKAEPSWRIPQKLPANLELVIALLQILKSKASMRSLVLLFYMRK